ncbi:MAG: hypothetical protein AUH30_08285 [Candidatus Rokubacteria bacterium 13_1_40CM_68_15]|nr:MAG: hypothetical protein AUH30_08285 [Candidatus Rokubacteria bacterium 13_1_40CM_68_15]
MGVNFTALESRFQTICWNRRGSATTGPTSSASSLVRTMLLASAAGRTASSAASTMLPRSTAPVSSVMVPVMMRLTSRRSLTSWFWL